MSTLDLFTIQSVSITEKQFCWPTYIHTDYNSTEAQSLDNNCFIKDHAGETIAYFAKSHSFPERDSAIQIPRNPPTHNN